MNIEEILKKIAKFQVKHAYPIFAIAVVVTLFMAYGAMQIELQTDINAMMSQDTPASNLQNKVTDKFGGSDMVLVVIQLESSDDPDAVKDIRDLRVLKMLGELGRKVENENAIVSVSSAASIFKDFGGIPDSQKTIDMVLKKIPESQSPFNDDYTVTLLYAQGDIKSEKNIKTVVAEIEEDIKETSIPQGVKVSVTGTPVIRTTLMDLLMNDMIVSMAAAAIIVLLLLILIHGSISKGLLPFIPLMFALVWTGGTMGYLGIPLSMVTVALGAMIIGIGIEFGVFVVDRYLEELKNGETRDDAIANAVSGVGRAVFASTTALTTGFLAMLAGAMPMMHDMGKTLAMGVIYAMLAAIFANPAFIIVEDDFMRRFEKEMIHTFDENIVEEVDKELHGGKEKKK